MDIIASARKDRPSSAWSLAFITNVNYYTFSTQYFIGARINLNIPSFIRNNHYIKHFESKTNLCFFKCLAYHYNQQHDAWFYLLKWTKYMFPNKDVTSDMPIDNPIQIGFFILQHAKLRILEFYYDCIAHYLKPNSYELMETDRDSLYMALYGKGNNG